MTDELTTADGAALPPAPSAQHDRLWWVPLLVPVIAVLTAAVVLWGVLRDPVWTPPPGGTPVPGRAYAWLTAIVLQGALSGIVAALGVALLVRVGRNRIDWRQTLVVPGVALAIVIGAQLALTRAQNELAPLGACRFLFGHDVIMRRLNFLGVSSVIATWALWSDVSRPWTVKGDGLLDLVVRHDHVRTLTFLLGLQVSLVVVATGELRAAAVAVQNTGCVHAMVADPELVLWYGVPYAAIVALVYAPCAIRLRQLALVARAELLGAPPVDAASVKPWAESAEALQKVVPMEQSLGGTLRDLIPIAAPILTSVVQSLTAD